MSANNNFIYTVYITVNLINQKFYVGVHKENGKKYLGSGTLLKKAIKKYGKENFESYILFENLNRKSAYNKESELVDKEFINREDTYNIKTGGCENFEHSIKTKEKIKNSLKGKILSDTHKERVSTGLKKAYENGNRKSLKGKTLSDNHKNKISIGNRGKIRTDEMKNNYSKAKSGIKHPMYGKNICGEHSKNLSKSKIGNSNARTVKVYCNNVTYKSLTDASMKLGISLGALRYRINSDKVKWENFYT